MRNAVVVALAVLSLAAAAMAQQPLFVDRTADLGLALANDAACWVDVDNDGWTDLCCGGVVWRNEDGAGFSKLAEGVGAVVAGDYDNDGFADLFSRSSLQAFRNDGGKGFTAVAMPELPACSSRGACWADLDSDGFLDLYVTGYEDWDAGITFPDLVLLNDRAGGFTLASTDERYRARGVTACDFDEDGDPDIYVSDYRLQPNVLWVNDGSGNVEDQAPTYGVVATSDGFEGGHSIGAAWGDFDSDGHIDLFAGNFAHVDNRGDQPKSRFLRSLGPDAGFRFEDLGPCGIQYQESYASPACADCDNDGDLDLFFTTVYGTASFNTPNFPVLFALANGFAVTDVTADAGVGGLPPTYQAAWADYDNDGDLDLVSGGKLCQNQTTDRHWLAVRLVGDGAAVNRSAIGAQVRIRVGAHTLTRQVEAGTGECNQNDLRLHFGLGAYTQPVTLEILWPGGARQRVEGVAPDQIVEVSYGG